MSDGLTTPPASPELLDARPEAAAALALAGRARSRRWRSWPSSPRSGPARAGSGSRSGTSRAAWCRGGQWFTGEAGLRDDFQGVAWYVAISLVAGLVLGVLAAWLFDRSELVTLVAVVVGSVLAAYLMLRVGTHLSPADPHELAKTAQDGDKLKGALRVTSWPPKGAFTFGALVGLALVYAVSIGRPPDQSVRPTDPPPQG